MPCLWRSGLENLPRKLKVGRKESQPQKTQVIKTGSDSYNAKHSALGATVTGPRI